MAWRVFSIINVGGLVIGAGALIFDAVAPPIASWHVSNWQVDADHVWADVSGLSLKGCHYVDGNTVGQVYEGGLWRRTNITADAGRSYPPVIFGWRDLGRWEWEKVKSGDVVARVMARATMLCGDAQVMIDVGPFDVGK